MRDSVSSAFTSNFNTTSANLKLLGGPVQKAGITFYSVQKDKLMKQEDKLFCTFPLHAI